jgi:hypothetical protein
LIKGRLYLPGSKIRVYFTYPKGCAFGWRAVLRPYRIIKD